MSKEKTRAAYQRMAKFILAEKEMREGVLTGANRDRKIAACDTATADLKAIGQTLASLYESSHLNELAQKLVALGDMVSNQDQRDTLSECLLHLDQHMQQDRASDQEIQQIMLVDEPVEYQTGDY